MMSSYYPLPPVGAYTGYMTGASPYLAAGGYSTGSPAGYPLPLPPNFHASPNTDYLTPSESQFERRHLDHAIDLSLTEWTSIISTAVIGLFALWLIVG